MLQCGLFLTNLTALGACAADLPSGDHADDQAVTLAPEEVAQLREQMARGAAVGAELPAGAQVRISLVTEADDDAVQPAAKGGGCSVADDWHHVAIAEPILICVGDPQVCSPSTITVDESVECTGSSTTATCPVATRCTASGLLGHAHSTARPGRAPDKECTTHVVLGEPRTTCTGG